MLRQRVRVSIEAAPRDIDIPLAPGMLASHYAPAGKLRLNAKDVRAGGRCLPSAPVARREESTRFGHQPFPNRGPGRSRGQSVFAPACARRPQCDHNCCHANPRGRSRRGDQRPAVSGSRAKRRLSDEHERAPCDGRDRADLSWSATPAQGEVLKFLRMCPEQKLCPYYELVLEPPKDWIEDKEASKQNGVQMMVPARPQFRQRAGPDVREILIAAGQPKRGGFRARQPGALAPVSARHQIEKIADVERTSGQPAFVSYRYENPSQPQQRFETISFALDKDKDGNTFFVMVAPTRKGQEGDRPGDGGLQRVLESTLGLMRAGDLVYSRLALPGE